MKNLLTIGAYDRDNFGDTLFLLILKKYATNYTVVPGGFTTADMRHLSNEIVLPFSALYSSSSWSSIWVTGGEVGGVTPDDAARLVIDEEFEYTYLHCDESVRSLYRASMCYNERLLTTAYIPSIPKNSKTDFYLSSVGLASLNKVPESVRTLCINTLRRAKMLWVRDPASLGFCEKHNLKAELAPDMVHIMPLIFSTFSRDKSLPIKYVILQMHQEFIESRGIRKVIECIKKIMSETDLTIVLFAAGTANHHDSLELYEQINKTISSNRIMVYQERDPLKLVGAIVNSRAWIGTSLHGRILAAGYSIPRISLVNDKVSTYAQHWDSQFPHNIELSEVPGALQSSLAIDSTHTQKSSELSTLSESVLKKMLASIAK